MSETELVVRAGAVVALRLFDVAYAIDLARARKPLWAAQARASSRLRLTATPPKAMAFGVPPLALELDPVHARLRRAGRARPASPRGFMISAPSPLPCASPVADLRWADFVQRLNEVDRTLGGSTTTDLWTRLLAQVRSPLAAALERAGRIHRRGRLPGRRWSRHSISRCPQPPCRQRVDLVPLLSGEQRALSDGARQDLLRQRFSYYTDDLVVLTWDRAFIYEPRGDFDVMDVLEVANAQLLEMRYYDELLDDELPRMYDLVAKARRTPIC